MNWKDPGAADAGGAELYVSKVVELWAADGHEVVLMTPRGDGPRSPEGSVSRLRAGNRVTIFPRARRLLRRDGAHFDRVLESVSTRPFFAHEFVGQRAVALYHQVADDVWHQEYPGPVAYLGRRVVEPRWVRRMKTATVVAVSPSTASDLARFGVCATGVVPPGNDPPPAVVQRSAPAAEPRVAFVGRLVHTKRPSDALEAFGAISSAFPGATLDVIGAGYLEEKLRASAPPSVLVHGHLSEARKREILASADLVLCPGTREGWGIVVMEAGAWGVPVVAYDIPGLRDAVVQGRTGILVPPSAAEMAAAAIRLLGDASTWRAMAFAGRQRALDHSWRRSADGLMAILAA